MGKGEIARYKQFLLSHIVFNTLRFVWERVIGDDALFNLVAFPLVWERSQWFCKNFVYNKAIYQNKSGCIRAEALTYLIPTRQKFQLDQTKLKAFADDKSNITKMIISVFDRAENTVGKEIALLFPQCFQTATFPDPSKDVMVWEWVKPCDRNIAHAV